jgi:hypothetical protein
MLGMRRRVSFTGRVEHAVRRWRLVGINLFIRKSLKSAEHSSESRRKRRRARRNQFI